MTQKTILLIKTSSLGDIVHSFPAISDAVAHGFIVDWCVDAAFADVARLHPGVRMVYPIHLRALKKQKSFRNLTMLYGELKHLKQQSYDFILDAQGLLKSAFISLWPKGERHGFTKNSVREPIASFFYQKKHAISTNQHAIFRTKALFSATLGTKSPQERCFYGLSKPLKRPLEKPYIILLHGTTWKTKSWPTAHWIDLARQLLEKDKQLVTIWGNPLEKKVAETIQASVPQLIILPRQSIIKLTHWLAHAEYVIGCDTGLMHLATAFNTPTISLYGASCPKKTGTLGLNTTHLASSLSCQPCKKRQCQHPDSNAHYIPCMEALAPSSVLQALESQGGYLD